MGQDVESGSERGLPDEFTGMLAAISVLRFGKPDNPELLQRAVR
ncbi:MAG TPA: hypothetical protein VGG16_21365 [Streptosporangiaceae bacterium]